MTKIFFIILFFWSGLNLQAQAPKASDEDPEFVEARRLFWSGQYKESEEKFKLYLVDHPNHEATKSFLQMIAQSRRFDPSKINLTREHLENIRIPHIEFKDTDWRSVTKRLQELANATKDGKPPKDYVNFVNMLPSGFSLKVSLDLKNVSLLRAIEHACRQAGLRYVIDTWAVIIDIPESKGYSEPKKVLSESKPPEMKK